LNDTYAEHSRYNRFHPLVLQVFIVTSYIFLDILQKLGVSLQNCVIPIIKNDVYT